MVPIHSAVSLSYKKNTFESILMRWMKLDPIIQLSQKYKHQYSILIYIYIYMEFIKMVMTMLYQFSSVWPLNRVGLFMTPWTVALQASLSNTNSQSFIKLVHQVGDDIQPFHPLSSPYPPFNLSQHKGLFQ